jgi:hypothetical protein
MKFGCIHIADSSHIAVSSQLDPDAPALPMMGTMACRVPVDPWGMGGSRWPDRQGFLQLQIRFIGGRNECSARHHWGRGCQPASE